MGRRSHHGGRGKGKKKSSNKKATTEAEADATKAPSVICEIDTSVPLAFAVGTSTRNQ